MLNDIPEFREAEDIKKLADDIAKELSVQSSTVEWLIRQFPQYDIDDYELREIVVLRLRLKKL